MLLFHGRKNFREMLWTFRYWMYIMGSSLKEMMIPMLKKLTALSLLICLSMLPSRAGAMDAAEDEPGVRAEEQISPEDADAGIAPWRMDCQDILGGNAGGDPGDGVPPAVPIKKGNGEPYLP